jgi:hypothetical protein
VRSKSLKGSSLSSNGTALSPPVQNTTGTGLFFFVLLFQFFSSFPFLHYVFFFERGRRRTAPFRSTTYTTSSSSSSLVLHPNYKTIWLTGFSVTGGLSKSWTEDFPLLFAYRYPDSEIFVLKQTSSPPFLIYRIERLNPKTKQDFDSRARSTSTFSHDVRLIPDPTADMRG